MHVIIEYLAIGVMLILFITVSLNVLSEVMAQLEHVKNEQVYTIAERLMDKLLLTPGYPEDWGRDFSQPITDLGLTLAGARSPYELDPDKVMRLANLTLLPNPLYLPPEEIAELLGVKGEYGIVIEMSPLLSFDVKVTEHYHIPNTTYTIPSTFEVSLYNWYGFRVPGVNITGIYVLAEIRPDGTFNHYLLSMYCTTRVTEPCPLKYKSKLDIVLKNPDPDATYYAFLILHTSWYGFVVVDGYAEPPEPGAPVEGYAIGDYVIIDKDVEGLRGAMITKDDVLQALPEYLTLLEVTDIEWVDPSKLNWSVEGVDLSQYNIGKVSYIEKLSSHIFVLGKWQGKPIVVVIDRVPKIKLTYPEGSYAPPNAVILTRIAHLYTYPYIVRMVVWRQGG